MYWRVDSNFKILFFTLFISFSTVIICLPNKHFELGTMHMGFLNSSWMFRGFVCWFLRDRHVIEHDHSHKVPHLYSSGVTLMLFGRDLTKDESKKFSILLAALGQCSEANSHLTSYCRNLQFPQWQMQVTPSNIVLCVKWEDVEIHCAFVEARTGGILSFLPVC